MSVLPSFYIVSDTLDAHRQNLFQWIEAEAHRIAAQKGQDWQSLGFGPRYRYIRIASNRVRRRLRRRMDQRSEAIRDCLNAVSRVRDRIQTERRGADQHFVDEVCKEVYSELWNMMNEGETAVKDVGPLPEGTNSARAREMEFNFLKDNSFATREVMMGDLPPMVAKALAEGRWEQGPPEKD